MSKDSRDGKALRKALKLYDRLRNFDKKMGGESAVLGVDEVGRGPLAGPLVAVCVELPYPVAILLPFLRDSKQLHREERELLARKLEASAIQIAYGVVEASEFGGVQNLHSLTFLAMERALLQLNTSKKNFTLLVDGKFPLPSWTGSQHAVVKGDDKSLSVAAASVLAKVFRDRRMMKLHREYPHYNFLRNVGYGTEDHRQALQERGPCPEHRPNFIEKIMKTPDTGSPFENGERRAYDS